MARGITESDVHTAADEIVGLGERPTVERVRAHLEGRQGIITNTARSTIST